MKSNSYKLSEASIKSNNEFAEANKTASLLYQRFQQIIPYKWERQRLNKFLKQINDIIRSGPQDLVGQRKLWDGDISRLLNFQLNASARAESLFTGKISTKLKPGRQVEIRIEPFESEEVFKFPQRAAFAKLKFYFICLDLADFKSSAKSILALNQPRNTNLAEAIQIQLPISEINNQLIIILNHVYFETASDRPPALIRNKKYMAASIIDLGYLKNGKLFKFIPHPQPKTILQDKEEIGVWEDL